MDYQQFINCSPPICSKALDNLGLPIEELLTAQTNTWDLLRRCLPKCLWEATKVPLKSPRQISWKALANSGLHILEFSRLRDENTKRKRGRLADIWRTLMSAIMEVGYRHQASRWDFQLFSLGFRLPKLFKACSNLLKSPPARGTESLPGLMPTSNMPHTGLWSLVITPSIQKILQLFHPFISIRTDYLIVVSWLYNIFQRNYRFIVYSLLIIYYCGMKVYW